MTGGALALAMATVLATELPPLPRDPAKVTANDLFLFNKPAPDRSKYPPAPKPLLVVIALGKSAWPIFDGEARVLRAAVKARVEKAAQEQKLDWTTVDWGDAYRDRSVHPKTGAQCAGRYFRPFEAISPAWATASLDVVCATTKLGDPVQHCDVDVYVRGPQGLTSTPYAELLRLHTKLAPPETTAGADARSIDVLVRAIEESVKVPSHEVDPKQGGLFGSVKVGNAERDKVPHWQTKLMQARVFRGADREGATAPDGARLKLYNALLACRAAEDVSGSQTGTFRAARDATSFQCEDGTRNPADSISACVCKTLEPFVAQGERWSFELRRPIEARVEKLRAFFLADLISTTDPRFTGHEVNELAVHDCLRPLKPTQHMWRRQRIKIDAKGNITELEAEGSPLPNDVARCWDDAMHATKLGCPVDAKEATLDVVYHLFPWGPPKAKAGLEDVR